MYVKNEVFTPQEIEEIKTYLNAGMGKELPDDFKKYLNKFSCQNASEVRDVLNETQEWEKSYNRSKSFDLDWIKHSIYTVPHKTLQVFCFFSFFACHYVLSTTIGSMLYLI
jgi:hypothetical protein